MFGDMTLVLVKPDGVLMGNVSAISVVYKKSGFEVLFDSPIRFTMNDAKEFYSEHKEKFYFCGTILSLCSDMSHVLILRGDDAIKRVRKLNGPTKPDEAPPGTIRQDFRSAGGPFNTVHSSDSQESFEREYMIVRAVLKRSE